LTFQKSQPILHNRRDVSENSMTPKNLNDTALREKARELVLRKVTRFQFTLLKKNAENKRGELASLNSSELDQLAIFFEEEMKRIYGKR